MFYYPVNFRVGHGPSFSSSQHLPTCQHHITVLFCPQQLPVFLKLQWFFQFHYSFVLCWGMIHWYCIGNCSTKNDLGSAIWRSPPGPRVLPILRFSLYAHRTHHPAKLGGLASLSNIIGGQMTVSTPWLWIGDCSASEGSGFAYYRSSTNQLSFLCFKVKLDTRWTYRHSWWFCLRVDLLQQVIWFGGGALMTS